MARPSSASANEPGIPRSATELTPSFQSNGSDHLPGLKGLPLAGLHAVPIGAAEVDHERLSMGQKRNEDAAESSELGKKAADRGSAHGAMLPLLRIRCQLGMEGMENELCPV